MYASRKLCKIRFFNSELENFKYLRFYLAFHFEISSGSLNLNIFSTFTYVMLQTWLKVIV